MIYRKSDGPFGLLPKKTAMDLEGSNELYAVPPRTESDPKSRRTSERDLSALRPVAGRPGAGDKDPSLP